MIALISPQASHIDKHDFLNAVVREKKHFEDVLDNSVAAGLNAATDALMNQASVLSNRPTRSLTVALRSSTSF